MRNKDILLDLFEDIKILQKLRLNVDLKTVIITEMHLNKKMVFHLPSTGNLKEISNKNIRFYS